MASGRLPPAPPLAALVCIAALCAAATALAGAGPLPQAAHAAAAPNGTYYLEGVGYATSDAGPPVPSQFGLAVSAGPAGPSGRSDAAISGGVVSFGGADYAADGLGASFLRGGDLIRISGTAAGRSGAAVEIGMLGKLVQDGRGGSAYLFTGRIVEGGSSYRALYSSAVSPVGGPAGADAAAGAADAAAAPSAARDGVTLRILPGASDRGLGSYSDRTGRYMSSPSAGYFEPTRLSIEPGTTVTIVNGDSVPHRIVSGTASGSTSRGELVVCAGPPEGAAPGSGRAQQGCTFTMDGRIDTGEIAPGSSAAATFSERALYRLADTEYAWMSIDVFAFGGAR